MFKALYLKAEDAQDPKPLKSYLTKINLKIAYVKYVQCVNIFMSGPFQADYILAERVLLIAEGRTLL